LLAEGIIKAAKMVNLKTPLVVRLTGTNSAQGAKMLEEFAKSQSQVKITTAVDLDDAAKKSVAIAKA
jgi:succinyl-CoA synthetase beta subunit